MSQSSPQPVKEVPYLQVFILVFNRSGEILYDVVSVGFKFHGNLASIMILQHILNIKCVVSL